MHFCKNCKNMHYIKIEDENCDEIKYYCRNCGLIDDETTILDKCILKEHITKHSTTINTTINKYTKFDMTLPRINYIKCPNEQCTSNNHEFDTNNREIIYLRYNNTDMQYMYLCSHCDFNWKIEK